MMKNINFTLTGYWVQIFSFHVYTPYIVTRREGITPIDKTKIMKFFKVFGPWEGEWADARLEKAGTPRSGEDCKIPLERLFLFQCYVEGACFKSFHIVEASCTEEARAKLKGEAWDGLDGSFSLDEFEEFESAQ